MGLSEVRHPKAARKNNNTAYRLCSVKVKALEDGHQMTPADKLEELLGTTAAIL
jgi:hypothetical protein